MMKPGLPEVFFIKDMLIGEKVVKTQRNLGALKSVFADQEAFDSMDQEQLAYEVYSYLPVEEGTDGGLFFGITCMYPIKVGGEYLMTKGHFHANRDTAEFYWGIEGEGMLLLMDEEGKCRLEKVFPGSLHYIGGCLAHRMINTCNRVFSFGACWPSDAGHDYGSIEREGFSVRVYEEDGHPVVKKVIDIE